MLGSKRIKVLSTLSPTAPITNTRFNSLLAPVAAIMKKTIKRKRRRSGHHFSTVPGNNTKKLKQFSGQNLDQFIEL